VTKRQSLKLLGELLLDRTNYAIMTKFISNPENLKLMMNLLREKSRNIQFEAFHVFKVFNTNRFLSQILRKQSPFWTYFSRTRINWWLSWPTFTMIKQVFIFDLDDEQFNDEKAFLIKQIEELKLE
jgi:calcium binding protein 39